MESPGRVANAAQASNTPRLRLHDTAPSAAAAARHSIISSSAKGWSPLQINKRDSTQSSPLGTHDSVSSDLNASPTKRRTSSSFRHMATNSLVANSPFKDVSTVQGAMSNGLPVSPSSSSIVHECRGINSTRTLGQALPTARGSASTPKAIIGLGISATRPRPTGVGERSTFSTASIPTPGAAVSGTRRVSNERKVVFPTISGERRSSAERRGSTERVVSGSKENESPDIRSAKRAPRASIGLKGLAKAEYVSRSPFLAERRPNPNPSNSDNSAQNSLTDAEGTHTDAHDNAPDDVFLSHSPRRLSGSKRGASPSANIVSGRTSLSPTPSPPRMYISSGASGTLPSPLGRSVEPTPVNAPTPTPTKSSLSISRRLRGPRGQEIPDSPTRKTVTFQTTPDVKEFETMSVEGSMYGSNCDSDGSVAGSSSEDEWVDDDQEDESDELDENPDADESATADFVSTLIEEGLFSPPEIHTPAFADIDVDVDPVIESGAESEAESEIKVASVPTPVEKSISAERPLPLTPTKSIGRLDQDSPHRLPLFDFDEIKVDSVPTPVVHPISAERPLPLTPPRGISRQLDHDSPHRLPLFEFDEIDVNSVPTPVDDSISAKRPLPLTPPKAIGHQVDHDSPHRLPLFEFDEIKVVSATTPVDHPTSRPLPLTPPKGMSRQLDHDSPHKLPSFEFDEIKAAAVPTPPADDSIVAEQPVTPPKTIGRQLHHDSPHRLPSLSFDFGEITLDDIKVSDSPPSIIVPATTATAAAVTQHPSTPTRSTFASPSSVSRTPRANASSPAPARWSTPIAMASSASNQSLGVFNPSASADTGASTTTRVRQRISRELIRETVAQRVAAESTRLALPSSRAGDLDAGRAWRALRRPSDMNEHAKEIRAMRARDASNGKSSGTIFVKVLGIEALALPLPTEPTHFCITLDNGIDYIRTPYTLLVDGAKVNQEFSLDEHANFEFSLSLDIRRDPHILKAVHEKQNPATPATAAAPAAAKPGQTRSASPAPSNKSAGFRSLFQSPRKLRAIRPTLQVQRPAAAAATASGPGSSTRASSSTSAARPETIATYLANGTSSTVGKTHVAFKPIAKQCEAKVLEIRYPMFAMFKEPPTAEGSSSAPTAASTRKQIAKITLQIFRLPPIPGGLPPDQMPSCIDECLRGLRHHAWHEHEYHEGTLTQTGGDCTVPRRRMFKLVGGSLVAINEVTKKRVASIDLRKAVALTDLNVVADALGSPRSRMSRMTTATVLRFRDEDEALSARPRSFQLEFNDGDAIVFSADKDEDKAVWMDTLNGLIGRIPSNPLWAELLAQSLRSSPSGDDAPPATPAKRSASSHSLKEKDGRRASRSASRTKLASTAVADGKR